MLLLKYLKERAASNNRGKIIAREPQFYELFTDFTKDNKNVIDFLNAKMDGATKGTTLTHRIINHWSSLGIINDTRENKNKWRRFSIIDRIWLMIVLELRDFGVSHDKILKLKKHFIDELTNTWPVLECYIMLTVKFKFPTYLLIFPDGYCEIATNKQIEESKFFDRLNENFISINLNEYIQKMLGADKANNVFTAYTRLNKEEMKIIEVLRTKKYKSVEIKLTNGKIERIHAKEQIALNEKRIIDLIKEKNYQEITIQTEGGKPIFIERTEKIAIGKTEANTRTPSY